MTIISDIWNAIEASEKMPFAIQLGVSGQHAFDAEMHWLIDVADLVTLNRLTAIQQLKRVDTASFDGWNLLFNDYPNPLRRKSRSKAA